MTALTAAGLSSAAVSTLCSNFASVEDLEDTQFGLDVGWLILCGALVFIMHGGFAMVSSPAVLAAAPIATPPLSSSLSTTLTPVHRCRAVASAT